VNEKTLKQVSFVGFRFRNTHIATFLPRNAMLARYMLWSRIRLSVRLSQAGIVWKPLDESSRFLAWRLPPTYPTLYCPKLRTSKITPRDVDRVVNNTRRRRRRSSLLTTRPIRQSTSRGCLLQVDQL